MKKAIYAALMSAALGLTASAHAQVADAPQAPVKAQESKDAEHSPNFIREGSTVFVSGHTKFWIGRLSNALSPRNHNVNPVTRVVFVNATSFRSDDTVAAHIAIERTRKLTIETVVVGSCDLFCVRLFAAGKTRVLGQDLPDSKSELAIQVPIDFTTKKLERRFPNSQVAVFEAAIPSMRDENKSLIAKGVSKPSDVTGGLFVGATETRYCDTATSCEPVKGVSGFTMQLLTSDQRVEVALPKTFPAPVPTGFAAINDLSQPIVQRNAVAMYKEFLDAPIGGSGRAFALSENGEGPVSWWAANGEDPVARAISLCQKKAKVCKLYAVDDYVVWNK
jgi:hypothetical protein